MIRKADSDSVKPRHAADNVRHTVKKPQEYRRHDAVTDMIERANTAMEQNRFEG